jgi:hypothetical protein
VDEVECFGLFIPVLGNGGFTDVVVGGGAVLREPESGQVDTTLSGDVLAVVGIPTGARRGTIRRNDGFEGGLVRETNHDPDWSGLGILVVDSSGIRPPIHVCIGWFGAASGKDEAHDGLKEWEKMITPAYVTQPLRYVVEKFII